MYTNRLSKVGSGGITTCFFMVLVLDDDSFIEEQIPDLFDWMDKKKLVYASNLLHLDCGKD